MKSFFLILILSVSVSAWADTASSIDLRQALTQSLEHNPQLAGYRFRHSALVGERASAALRPEIRLQTELENLAGSGNFSGTDSAELTLSFSSVIELGNQRDARINLVTARQQHLATEQRVAVLDLVAAVNYRFVTLLAAQEQLRLQLESQQLAQTLVSSLNKQVDAGRKPKAELLRAQAAFAKSDLAVNHAQQQVQIDMLKLSAYWADNTPDFIHASGDLFTLNKPDLLINLQSRLAQNPDFILLADETRLRAAEVRKAEAEGRLTLGWHAGIRQLEATDDRALVVGVNIPLTSGKRASGAIQTARAERDAAEFAEGNIKVLLDARLTQTYASYTQALNEVYKLREQIIPLLEEANRATSLAFDQGRYSSLELALTQNELLEAHATLINSALRAHENYIELERLTASAPLTSELTSELTP